MPAFSGGSYICLTIESHYVEKYCSFICGFSLLEVRNVFFSGGFLSDLSHVTWRNGHSSRDYVAVKEEIWRQWRIPFSNSYRNNFPQERGGDGRFSSRILILYLRLCSKLDIWNDSNSILQFTKTVDNIAIGINRRTFVEFYINMSNPVFSLVFHLPVSLISL